MAKVLLLAVIVAITYYFFVSTGFQKDHDQAEALAAEISLLCTQDEHCPESLEKVKIEALPRVAKYGVSESATLFALFFQGGYDPECSYIIEGGVAKVIVKRMVCDITERNALYAEYLLP